MKRRYRIQCNTHFIEAEFSDFGRRWLEGQRALRAGRYKGRHIRDIIQAHPDKIKPGEEYELT